MNESEKGQYAKRRIQEILDNGERKAKAATESIRLETQLQIQGLMASLAIEGFTTPNIDSDEDDGMNWEIVNDEQQ